MNNRQVARQIMEKVANHRQGSNHIDGILKEAYLQGVNDGMEKVASFGSAGSGSGYGSGGHGGGGLRLDPAKFKINLPSFKLGDAAKGSKGKLLAVLAALAAGSYGVSKLLDGREQAPPPPMMERGLAFAKANPLLTGAGAGLGATGLYALVRAVQGGSMGTRVSVD